MFKIWQKSQKPFTGEQYQFKIFELWREAFQAARPLWIRFIALDILLIIIMHFHQWAPLVLKAFPMLAAIIPPLMVTSDSNPLFSSFAHLSTQAFPILFFLFVTTPIYLGIVLISLRAAYQRPTPTSLVSHYLNFCGWMQILSLAFFAFLIFFPLVYGLLYFSTPLLLNASAPIQAYIGFILTLLIFFGLITMLSMTVYLVAAARIHVVYAIIMSWKAVKIHYWRVFGMIVISYAVFLAGRHSWYLFDLILVPPNFMAWAILYRRMFGEQGLIE